MAAKFFHQHLIFFSVSATLFIISQLKRFLNSSVISHNILTSKK